MPSTQYLGSKQKLIGWILSHIPECNSVLDAFSGSAVVAYNLKRIGKRVIANDYLTSSYLFAKALVENNTVRLKGDEITSLFRKNPGKDDYLERHFAGVFYTNAECYFLDNLHSNILELSDEYKRSIAFSAAVRTCIQKMPGGKFRANLLKYREKSFKHYRPKYTKSIEDTFRRFLQAYNDAVFDNGKQNEAHNENIFDLLGVVNADLAYFDPPYGGTGFDYQRDYFFVELYTRDYGKIEKFNGVTKTYESSLQDEFKRSTLNRSLKRLFESSSRIPIWIISYNNRSLPKLEEFKDLIEQFRHIEAVHSHKYSYKSGNSAGLEELLFICK